MAEKPDYDGLREKAGFRWSVSAAYYAYYALTGIPIKDANTRPEAMIELIRQGRPKFRELWGDEIPMPGISTPAVSYGHLNTLGAGLVFPEGGEVNYTRICGSLGDGLRLLKRPVDFRTAGMVPFYLNFRERLRKAFPGENVGFGFSAQGPMTTAYCLRDLGIFTDVYDDPNGTKEFLSLITESVLDYRRFLADLNGHPHVSPTGYKLYDDVGSMFSVSMWPEFVLPHYERVFEASTTGRRAAHIEDLRPEHLPLLEDVGLVDFDPGISHKINPKIIRQRCRVPFGWRMGSFHYAGLTMQEVEEWVYQAAADGASYVFTTVEATMCQGSTPDRVKAFMRAAKKVEQMMKEGALRSDVGEMVSHAGRRRFWDRWPQ